MTFGAGSYWIKKISNTRKPRIVMALLVRNEEDIIEMNIRFHANKGVNAFIVMDNGSIDRTCEIIQVLAGEYDLKIIKCNDDSFRQSRWMTNLAVLAYDKFGADLVIPNDADEFWIPNNGESLAACLNHRDVAVYCNRYNMIPEMDNSFKNTQHCVVNPIPYTKEFQLLNPNVSLLLNKLRQKVLVNPRGLLKITQGNHRAIHIYSPLFSRTSADICIYHYPIRSLNQFQTNARIYKKILANSPAAKIGSQWRRWAAIESDEQLEQEFRMMTLKKEEIEMLYRLGILESRPLPARELSAITLTLT